MTLRARELSALVACFGVCAALAAPAVAVPVPFTMQSRSFDQLGATVVAGAAWTEPYEHSMVVEGQTVVSFSGTITSAVYTRADGRYLYLYQAVNDGPSSLERLAVLPFYGMDTSDAGVVTGAVPGPFLSDGLSSLGGTYESEAGIPPTVGYDYQAVPGYALPAGEHTNVFYVISPNAPVEGEAHVINAGVDNVPAWVADVPEPATLGLLAAGLFALTARKRRRA